MSSSPVPPSPEGTASRSAAPAPGPRRAAITAVGHFLPEERLTNADLEAMVDTSDEWIRSRTGIRERRILRPDSINVSADGSQGPGSGKESANGEEGGPATAYMATEAARELLDKRGLDADAIDAIIVATVTPDMFFPATACLVQADLGASRAYGFDLSAACSGFLYALATGARFVESGQCEKVLVIGADTMTRIVDFTDRSTCILFGDGAGAVLLEARPADGPGLVDTYQRTDGRNWQQLCQPAGGSRRPATHRSVDAHEHFLKQEGRPVFKKAVRRMTEACTAIMERNDLEADDVRYLVPHQANRRIIEATAQQMNLPMEQVMVNIGRYGNTTAATIPLCLHDWEADLRPGDRLLLATFGGGFTWGAGLLRWAYDGAEVSRGDAREQVLGNDE